MFLYNILASLAFAAMSVYVLLESRSFPDNPMSNVQPGSWPGFLGWILLGLSALLLAETLIKRFGNARGEEKNEPAPFDFKSKGMLYVYALCGIFVVFGFVMHYVNFTIASLILIPSCMYLLGEKRPWMLAAVTAAVPVAIYFIFVRILGIMLP